MKLLAMMALLLVCSYLLPVPRLYGQSDVGDNGVEPHWQSAAFYLHQQLPEQVDWRSLTLIVGHASPTRTVLLEVEMVERAAARQAVFGADLYQNLPTGGYVGLRARVAPGAEVLPRVLVATDLFHPMEGGWEGWIGYRHRAYPRSTVHAIGLGPGLYIGQWYLRGPALLSRAQGETTVVGKLLARRLIAGSPADYVELGAGLGSEFVEMVPGRTGRIEIESQPTVVLSARAQLFLTSRLGLTAGGVYQSYEGLGSRPSFTMGILGRW